MRLILSSFMMFLVLLSCKTRSKAEENSQTSSTDSVSGGVDGQRVATTLAFYEKVLIPPKFTQLKITGKVEVNIPNTFTPQLNSTMYIVQDEKIWMNMNVLFINAARALATPNGIEAYVKTERSYIQSDFHYINNLLNVNFINYKTLEKLLLGRTFVKLSSKQYQMHKTKEGYTLASVVPQQFSDTDNEGVYHVKLEYAENYDLLKVDLQDTKSKNKLFIEYLEWVDFEQMRLPKYVKIIIKGGKSGEILLENTKFESQKMNTPFSIPKNYSKIEIQ